VLNLPLNYIDPTGHAYICAGGCDDPDQGVGWSLNEVVNCYRPSADLGVDPESYRQQTLVMEAAVNIHNAGRQRITSQSPQEIKEYFIELLYLGAEQRLVQAGNGSSGGTGLDLTSGFAAAGVLGNFGRSLSGGGGAVVMRKRYDGPKPTYEENPAHIPGRPGFNRKKTPLPADAEEVYKRAVPGDDINLREWFGKNRDGQIYRYSVSNGKAHFSGVDGVGDVIRNLSPYARERLKELSP
jgi:hypothetical protein